MSVDSAPPFSIRDCALLSIATGWRIYTLGELRAGVAAADDETIYFHFWGSLLQPRFEEREFNNDFAAWIRHDLHDAKLAEQVAVVDPREFPNLGVLKSELLDLIDERLVEAEYLHFSRSVRPFEFMRAQIVVFGTDKSVTNPEQLGELVPQLSVSSIFYHFIDARRRVPTAGDDFSAWLANFGETGTRLCDRLAQVDPYFIPLTILRDQLAAIFAEELGGDHAAR
ncbi:MAG: DUF5752 family protein [Thiohalomonadaceae bacterium]